MALYHKHRPQTFDSVVGQEHIIQTITNQIIGSKVSHAYLFSGPRGIGKTTTARLLAKAVNCTDRKPDVAEPCDTCDSCTDISNSRAIDVIEIDAASHTGVDNVRTNIIDNAHFRPTKSAFKVFIIDEVHMLSTSAFNALLKIMEEPPTHVMFILATTERHKLPDTIISRTQQFSFTRVDFKTLKKHIESIAKAEGVKLDSAVVERLINKSDGCVRDAVSLLDQLMAAGEKTITPELASIVLPSSNIEENLAFVSQLIERDADAALQTLANVSEQDIDLNYFAHETLEVLRLMLVLSVSKQTTGVRIDLSDNALKQIKKLVGNISPAELVGLIDLTLKRKQQIRTAPLPQLPLEMLVVEYCVDRKQKAESRKQDDDSGNNPSQPEQTEETTDSNNQEKPAATKDDAPNEVISKTISTITLEEVRNAWPQCLSAVEQSSPSLVFILKMAQLHTVNNGALTLHVSYRFHKDKLMASRVKKEIEQHFLTALGQPVELLVEVNESLEQEKPAASADLQNLASALGGEVVA